MIFKLFECAVIICILNQIYYTKYTIHTVESLGDCGTFQGTREEDDVVSEDLVEQDAQVAVLFVN